MIIFTSFPYVIMTKKEYRADQCSKETEACKSEIAEMENRNIRRDIDNLLCEIQALRNQHELDKREIHRYKSMLERSETIVKAADKRIAYLEEKMKELKEDK